MVLEVNGARGEVALKVGGIDLVIAATMEGLAAVSTHLGCKSLEDLFVRLSAVEVAATRSAIMFLTVKGDHEEAIKQLGLSDFAACNAAFVAALGHHFEGNSGNVKAAEAPAKAA